LEIYPYLRQIVFDLALSLTYGARQKDANDEFVVALIENINIISYASPFLAALGALLIT